MNILLAILAFLSAIAVAAAAGVIMFLVLAKLFGYQLGPAERLTDAIKTRLSKMALCFLALIAAYGFSWSFSGEIRLTHSMANFRYFYYGSKPDSTSDKLLYIVYYLPYRLHLAIEDHKGEGRDFVHWSDRRD